MIVYYLDGQLKEVKQKMSVYRLRDCKDFKPWEVALLNKLRHDLHKYQIAKYNMLKFGYSEPILSMKLEVFDHERKVQQYNEPAIKPVNIPLNFTLRLPRTGLCYDRH